MSWLSRETWGIKNGIWLADAIGLSLVLVVVWMNTISPMSKAIVANGQLSIMAQYIQIEAGIQFPNEEPTIDELNLPYRSETHGNLTSSSKAIELSEIVGLPPINSDYVDGSLGHILALSNYVLTGEPSPSISYLMHSDAEIKIQFDKIVDRIRSKYSYGLL